MIHENFNYIRKFEQRKDVQFVIVFLIFLLKQGLAEVLDDVHFVQGTFSYTGQDEDEVTNPFLSRFSYENQRQAHNI